MQSECNEIDAVVRCYLDGLHAGDVAKLQQAFHPVCHLYALDDNGQVTDLPRDTWTDLVGQRASPQAQGLARDERIVSIDLASPTMAVAKLDCTIAPRCYTDLLVLLKCVEGWRIVAKSYWFKIMEE